MPDYYLDASAAVKAYSEEAGADRVEEVLNGDAGVYLSRVGIVEVVAAIFGKTRTGEMGYEDAVSAAGEFTDDLDIYRIIEVSASTTERAMEIARIHRLRAYDCLQLATAVLLQEQRVIAGLEALTFMSSDGELNAAAENEGLMVEDPARDLQSPGADDPDEQQ